jgi:hypothetical protein
MQTQIIKVKFLEDKTVGSIAIVSKTGNIEEAYDRKFQKGEVVKTTRAMLTLYKHFLQETQDSNLAAHETIEEYKSHSDSQIANLKKEYEHIIDNHKGLIYNLEQENFSLKQKNQDLSKSLLEAQNALAVKNTEVAKESTTVAVEDEDDLPIEPTNKRGRPSSK